MKIYVITKGIYSDYHICAVATDKEKAEELAVKFNKEYYHTNIEIYDTEDYRELLRYKYVYSCLWYKENNSIKVNRQDDIYDYDKTDYIPKKTRYGAYVYVLANTDEEALRFASDKFAKYRAEKERL